MRHFRYVLLFALLALLELPAAPAGAAVPVSATNRVIVTGQVTQLDQAGNPLAAPLAASGVNRTWTWGTPSAGGRRLFSVDVEHEVGCIFNRCADAYHHITQVDLAWVRDWHWVHVNAWAKYTPVGSQATHYDGQSQTFGNDQANYFAAPWCGGPCPVGSAFHYRGTAQNVWSIPMFGDVYYQDATDMSIFYDGTMFAQVRQQ
jgi:hypothetical protein